MTNAIAKAARDAGVKNIVSLSSIGADKSSGTGPVVGLHNFEQKLNQIDGANVLHLRPGFSWQYFAADCGHEMGFAVGPVRPDLKLPMIFTCDIGKAAAGELLRLEFRGKQTRELHGQRDLDYMEVASIIGKAIGKPDLKYIHASDDQVRPALVQSGMSDNPAGLIIEMAHALNSGHMRPLEPRNERNTTETKYEDS